MTKLKASKQLIFINRYFSTKEEAINEVYETAKELGYVSEGFYDDILQREREFPTGLPTEIPLAMPHIDTNCKTSFMSLITLCNSVEFNYMDGTEGKLPVQLIFLFGIVNPKHQIDILRRLMELFQNPKALKALITAKSDEEGFRLLEEHLGDLLETE